MAAPVRHRPRVRYAERDAQGVVFNARYLTYMDVAVRLDGDGAAR